jgi:hypothetical protein
MTITSAQSSAAPNAAFSSRTSSPTTAFSRTSTPTVFNCSVMNSEFVSTRNGVSSSLPTAMMQAFIEIRPLCDHPASQIESLSARFA